MRSGRDGEMISVVIVNFNRCEDLRNALSSIREQDYESIEIIVVDNASSDKSAFMLSNEFPDVSVISLSENIGMDGYSIGFQQARGEFIFQMDNDSIMPNTNVLSEVVRRFRSGPENLAVVATRVEDNPDNVFRLDDLWRRDSRQGPLNTGGFHSGGVCFRHSHLDNVGYYNRDIFLYGSELFLQMKLLAKGYKIFFYPEILMIHKSSNVARSSRSMYYIVRNRYWFMRCFATTVQKMRFLPGILFHDIVNAINKTNYSVFWQALKEGFGPLPPSLKPIRSCEPDFFRKVNEVGNQFNMISFLKRIKAKV